jgi:hypothetical protein
MFRGGAHEAARASSSSSADTPLAWGLCMGALRKSLMAALSRMCSAPHLDKVLHFCTVGTESDAPQEPYLVSMAKLEIPAQDVTIIHGWKDQSTYRVMS